MRKAADLPNDVEALKAELVAARALVIEQKIELEKLRFEIACLKRMKYGRSSEQLDTQIAQMQLTLEDRGHAGRDARGATAGSEGSCGKAGAPCAAGAPAARGRCSRHGLHVPGL